MLCLLAASGAHGMEVGTNLWFRANWSGELPFKPNTDFAAAWNNGKSGYLLKTNIWSQSFLDDQAPFNVIRFMDWNTTNGNQQVSWDQRTLPTKSVQSTAPSEGGTGIAYEWMIDLCNRLGVNMWINLPVRANDDYMVQLATLLRDTLDPSLQIYVELSNEVWNFADQGNYAASAGLSVPALASITSDSERKQKWVGYRSAQMWSIFRSVFGSEFDARIVRTMCGQSTNSGVSKNQLDAVYSPTINTTGERPDAYGIAPYFAGKNLDGNLPNILQVDGDITKGLLYRDIFVERQEGSGVDSGKSTPLDNVDAHRSRLNSYDPKIRLVAYEGGQHIKVNAVAPNTSPYMYDVYKVYLDALAAHKMDLFNHYTTVGYFTAGGCWGAKEFTGQDAAVAHTYRALVDWIATNDGIPGAPVIRREPVDAQLAVGEDTVFHVLADGNYKLTYQWQIDTGTGWTDLNGETSNAVTVTNAQASQNLHKYRCRITNTEATVYSAPATLNVGGSPFKKWLQDMGVDPETNPELDPTGEGVSLLQRYAHGFTPDQQVAGRLPALQGISGQPAALVLNRLAVDPEATGAVTIVETSHYLNSDWAEAFRYVAGAETANGATVTARTPNAEGHVDLTLTLSRADGGSHAGFFARVIVEQLP